jgi:hypothetical protein
MPLSRSEALLLSNDALFRSLVEPGRRTPDRPSPETETCLYTDDQIATWNSLAAVSGPGESADEAARWLQY